jgi:hypothetical protein
MTLNSTPRHSGIESSDGNAVTLDADSILNPGRSARPATQTRAKLVIPAEAPERWQIYCHFRERAERSHDLADGVAAGHAWRHFLQAFTGEAA